MPWLKGTGRFGIRVIAPSALVGDISNTGTITVQGNNSAGISIESGLTGNLIDTGSISITGDHSTGVAISNTASVIGNVTLGAITATGVGVKAADIEGAVGGKAQI